MQVTIDLPEDVGRQLQEKWTDLPRGVLETLAIEGYRSGELSRGQVARMLGFETPMAVDAFRQLVPGPRSENSQFAQFFSSRPSGF